MVAQTQMLDYYLKAFFNIAGIGIIALIIKEVGVDIGLQPKVQ